MLAAINGIGVTRFSGGQIVRGNELFTEDLWVENGSIIDPMDRFFSAAEHRSFAADRTIDCRGLIISAGLIDIQLNGAFGIDFSTPLHCTSANIAMVRMRLCENGVTSFCPTVITSSPCTYRLVLPLLQPCEGGGCGAGMLGLHLEGPFISDHKYGAHPREWLKEPSQASASLLDCYGSLIGVSIITLAPELAGALDAVRQLRKHKFTALRDTQSTSTLTFGHNSVLSSSEMVMSQYGDTLPEAWSSHRRYSCDSVLPIPLSENRLVFSCGHSMASFDQSVQAVDAGCTLITHLFNAMVPFHHRDPGLVGLLGAPDCVRRSIFYSLIVDGIHAHPASVKIAYSAHPDGAILVTDAIQAQGLPPGNYSIGEQQVVVHDGRAELVSDSAIKTLAGSIVTMDQCVRNFMRFANVNVAAAIEAASANPARLLGIYPRKGSLGFGSDADLVLWRASDWSIAATVVMGHLVYVDGPIECEQASGTVSGFTATESTIVSGLLSYTDFDQSNSAFSVNTGSSQLIELPANVPGPHIPVYRQSDQTELHVDQLLPNRTLRRRLYLIQSPLLEVSATNRIGLEILSESTLST